MTQKKKDQTATEPPRSFVEENLDDAYALREEKTGLQDRTRANRDILRALQAAGKLDAEQEAELRDLYPPRTKAEENGDDVTADPAGDPGERDDQPPAE